MMLLSPHFSLAELTATNYPQLQDRPSLGTVINLTWLCATILEPLRISLGRPVVIGSGYRSEMLNRHVGGVPGSYHKRGLAADIHIDSQDHARQIFNILQKNPWVDVCLFEHQKTRHWIHVQTVISATPRRHFNFNYQA